MASPAINQPVANLEAERDASIADRDGSIDGKKDEVDLETAMTTQDGQTTVYTEAQYKKLTRKIDLYLMPVMFFMYGIQQTDKTSISIQALFGMNDEVGLKGQEFQWLTTIFYLTYLVGEFPSTWLLQRFQAGRVLTIYIIGWSVCMLCISACNNWSQLMALRALQGFFECNISPGFLLITGAWYRTEEHANRSLYWQSSQGFFTVICNLMLYGIARYVTKVGGISPWRVISLFLGGLTLVGAVWCWLVLGTPEEVRWLTAEEKDMAKARTIDNQTGDESPGKRWDWDQFWECFKDPQVYFAFANTFLACIPNGGITTFSSLLYKTFGFDTWGSMLFSLPRNAMYVLIFILVALYLRRFQDQRMYIMIASAIIPFIGVLVMSLMPNTPEHKWLKWGMFDVTVVFSLALFLGWSMITSNVAGRTKRTVVSSMILIAYCVGNMAGAQVFRTEDAPRYVGGTIACSVCFALEVVTIILWRLWYMYENRRRDRWAAEQCLSKEDQERLGREEGGKDSTDRQNPHFRYSM